MSTATVAAARTHVPLDGHPVDLVIDGGWRLPVGPESDVFADAAVLTPLCGGAALPLGAEQMPATLEWRSCAGLVRRRGTLVPGEDGRLVLVAAGEPEVVQRRRFARVDCRLRTVVEGARSSGDVLTRTVDLSIGGMLIENAEDLELGERVRFTLGMPGQADIVSTGVVARVLPFGYRAISFDGLRPGDETRVARFVFAQQREDRAGSAD